MALATRFCARRERAADKVLRLAYNILQAAGCRSFKTDYVACPSCGRTLFNLQTVTARIKARTEHLKGVKIAIMGCIVNGPGEMADADFRLRWRRAEQDQSLRRQEADQVQHPRSRGGGTARGPEPENQGTQLRSLS
jgi:4-hydroxy-3-methylbut-2-en-1-yl diphosphate synthase IspG/GcpE